MNDSIVSSSDLYEDAFARIAGARDSFTPQLALCEIGTITSVSVGIAKVSGLPGVGFDELIKFSKDQYGIAFNVDEDEIGVVLLGDCEHLHAGAEVERTGRVMDVPVGDGLIGRVVDPLGGPLDGNGPVVSSKRLPIERPARPIMDRAPVTEPLQTGLLVVDSLVPIGRGQRELIVGDRQTGKLRSHSIRFSISVLRTWCASIARSASAPLLSQRSSRTYNRKERWSTPSSS